MRLAQMQRSHPNVIPVAPRRNAIPYCQAFDPVEAWMPDREDVPAQRREWFKCDATAISAVHQLGIDADFYWFIESDVAATQERWQAFFAEFENRTDDCLCLERYPRGVNPHWQEVSHEADFAFIMAVYRLSRRMVQESITQAESLRNVFCEMAVPIVAARAGFSVGTLHQGGHYTRSTIAALPRSIRIDRNLINHPVKTNTLGP